MTGPYVSGHTSAPRVIFVSIMRLTDRVAAHWFVDYLFDHGVDLEYWDVVEAVRDPHDEMGGIERPYLRRFRSLDEIELAVRRPENSGTLYMMLITYSGQFTNIYRLLSKHHAPMAAIIWGVLPTNPAPAWRKLVERWSSPLWLATTAFYMIKARAWRQLGFVRPYTIVFAAGRIALQGEADAARRIAINSVDYDEHTRTLAADKPVVEGAYAVFLDINLPYQSDLSLVGLRAVQASAYYKSLNRFFATLEREFAVRVVIALHPKAAYGSEKFEGREAYRGVTAALVRDARFVVSHTSTAMSYAVLFEKPLLFVSTDEMERLYKDNVMREMQNYARYLDASIVNADRVDGAGSIRLQPVNRERYARYRYDFLTSPASEGESTREIVLRELLHARGRAMNDLLSRVTNDDKA